MDSCPTCGLAYNPDDEKEIIKHEDYHEAFIKASGRFGLIYHHGDREQIKKDVAYILQDPTSSFGEKLSIAEEDLRAYFSRSLIAAKFSSKHVPFDVYASMLLNSENHYRKHYGNDVYNALLKKFGKRQGIKDKESYYLIKENL